MRTLLVFAALLFVLPAHAQVTIEWVTVGDPGNACETQVQGCFGAVAYAYRIGTYEVTNAQYAGFLNAVAATDTYALYNPHMDLNTYPSHSGGITRAGSSGSYTYSAIAGREDKPVNWVSFYDALRFANWMHNGQGSGDTETGAYTITADGITNNSITRNAGARVFLTSEDEWYKAAYYKGGGTSAGYWDYPAESDSTTTCTTPGATANTANCDDVVGDLTNGGSYTGSPSPAGTFDQGGNVHEWTEAITGSNRVSRGGAMDYVPSTLRAAFRGITAPGGEGHGIGFRVAMISEPTVAHWRFEEGPHGAPLVTAVDSGPNGLDGTPHGTLSYSSDVALTDDSGDFALDTTGDYNYVIVLDAPALRLADDFTVETYVLPDNTSTNPSADPHYILMKRHTPANGTFLVSYGLVYDQTSGFFRAIVGFGSDTGERATSTSDYLEERWYHVALTFDNDSVSGNATLRLYVDGELVDSNTFTNPGLYYTTEPFLIGAGNFGGPTHQWRRNFDGLIDEVRISDRVLSPEEFLAPPPPEGVPTLSPLGLVVVAVGLLGFGAYRRGRA